jgi:hypothetical protein
MAAARHAAAEKLFHSKRAVRKPRNKSYAACVIPPGKQRHCTPRPNTINPQTSGTNARIVRDGGSSYPFSVNRYRLANLHREFLRVITFRHAVSELPNRNDEL